MEYVVGKVTRSIFEGLPSVSGLFDDFPMFADSSGRKKLLLFKTKIFELHVNYLI